MKDEYLNNDLTSLHGLRDQIAEDMFGVEPVINSLLIALLMRGHVLLEGNPGLGKTVLIRTLARKLGLATPLGSCVRNAVGRIQFTPDLMPSDITGTKLPDENDRLVFQPGPVFSNLLLADEINRATPKTQSAMLEAMAEFQVSVLGETYPLSEKTAIRMDSGGATIERKLQTPFLVMATQNPVEQEGTNPLPEAQLDRFLFKVRMPFPGRETLARIVQKDVNRSSSAAAPAQESAETTIAGIDRLGAELRQIAPAESVQQHILNLVLASVGQFNELQGISGRRIAALRDFCQQEVEYPLGPRAAVSLTLAALGWSALNEVRTDEFEQVAAKTPDAFAAIVVPVLRHRIGFASSSGGFDLSADGGSPQDNHDELLRELTRLTAPDDGAGAFAARLSAAKETAPF